MSSPRRYRPTSAATMRGPLRRLLAPARQVRGHDEVRRGQQPRPGRDRLLGEDVEGGAEQVAGVQRVAHGVVVQQRPACAVHEHRPGLHQGDLRGPDHLLVVGRHAGVQGDEARARQQLVELHLLDPGGEGLRCEVRVVGEHVRAEAREDARDPAADRPVADHPDGAVLQFGAHGVVAVVVAAPGAAREVRVRLRDASSGGDQHADALLGGRRRVAARRVGDGDAVFGGRRDVGVHRSAPADAEQPQVGGGVEDLLRQRRHLGHADLDAPQGLDHLVLAAGRLVDLRDPAERLGRPAQGQLADLQAVGHLACAEPSTSSSVRTKWSPAASTRVMKTPPRVGC